MTTNPQLNPNRKVSSFSEGFFMYSLEVFGDTLGWPQWHC